MRVALGIRDHKLIAYAALRRQFSFLTPINAVSQHSAMQNDGSYHNTNSRPFSALFVNSTLERWSRKEAEPMKALLRNGFFALAILLASPVPANAGPYEDGIEAAERGDYATALKLWRPLAEQGIGEVQYSLGIMYDNGWGVLEDDAEAAKWYRKAAEQGVAEAQFSLGDMCNKGHTTRIDTSQDCIAPVVPILD
jgi:TPR repeat protein